LVYLLLYIVIFLYKWYMSGFNENIFVSPTEYQENLLRN